MKDSKEYILKIAFSLFITKGYKAVTLKELENATKLTKGAFYHYFKSKEEIFSEVLDKYYLMPPVSVDLETIPDLESFMYNSISLLKDKMLALREITGGEIPDPYYLTLILEAKKFFPSLEEKIKRIFRMQINQWEKVIVNAKENGEISNDIESFVLAESFTAMGLGIIKNLLLDESVEYVTNKLRLQYEQIYQLIKVKNNVINKMVQVYTFTD